MREFSHPIGGNSTVWACSHWNVCSGCIIHRMRTALMLSVIVVFTPSSRLDAQNPQASNHIAYQKLQDASHYWCPTSTACNPPTIKQCRADLTAWNQADQDWKDAVLKDGKPYNRPVALLSTEELYRRREEASMCGHVLTLPCPLFPFTG
jgi:hypothetical protein